MENELHIGYQIRTLSNLMKRKMLQLLPSPPDDSITGVQGQVIGFLYHHRDQDIYQKDLEQWFCVRRSTASRLLKNLEERGIICRTPVAHDARLKKVTLTPEALARQEEFYGFKDAFLVVAADGLVEQKGRVGTLSLGREVPLHGSLRRTAGAPGEHLHGQHGADHPAQQIADKTRAAAGDSPAGVGWRSRKRGRGMSEANAEAHEQTLGVETR